MEGRVFRDPLLIGGLGALPAVVIAVHPYTILPDFLLPVLAVVAWLTTIFAIRTSGRRYQDNFNEYEKQIGELRATLDASTKGEDNAALRKVMRSTVEKEFNVVRSNLEAELDQAKAEPRFA